MKKQEVSHDKDLNRPISGRKQNYSNHHPTHESIAMRAYEIYIERGAAPGRDLDDWLQAEQELTGKKKSSTRRQSLVM